MKFLQNHLRQSFLMFKEENLMLEDSAPERKKRKKGYLETTASRQSKVINFEQIKLLKAPTPKA